MTDVTCVENYLSCTYLGPNRFVILFVAFIQYFNALPLLTEFISFCGLLKCSEFFQSLLIILFALELFL
jgi:hypothetical protein